MTTGSRVYIGTVLGIGLVVLTLSLATFQCANAPRLLAYLAIAAASALFKVRLPAATGGLSLNFLFILIGIVELSLSETLLIGLVTTVIELFRRGERRPGVLEAAFRISNMPMAIAATHAMYRSPMVQGNGVDGAIPVLIAATVFFIMNSFSLASDLSLKQERSLREVWNEGYLWGFPCYLVGGILAWLFGRLNHTFGWQFSALALPVLYLIARSYTLSLGRMADQRRHAQEMSGLHLRTIEALALAIEAKDQNTHSHLQRVQMYALAVGEELGLSPTELEALRAASLLHDIGKLAVPEHIISKPGKLTPEEFHKMKIHPVVGSEILQRVEFPYPVVPIVRHHHERWNGGGYPDGLRGEEIPIGARILAAVDFLDALASDRQYRRALPIDEVMKRIAQESGVSFDPRVVEVLQRRYRELEAQVKAGVGVTADLPRLSTGLLIEGGAPASGWEKSSSANSPAVRAQNDFLDSIAAAREEAQLLFELAGELGSSLSLDETLSVLGMRMKRLVPFDALAIYIRRDNTLRAEYACGDNVRLFSSLEIPIGQGLSGWVAENRKPILNGNPAVEPGYLDDPARFSTMRSALAAPLESVQGVIGVITLYREEKDGFERDHLRLVQAVSSKLAFAIENALRYRQAESSASTDYLTGLPNARSLFLQLESELARCRRLDNPLIVLVTDLDGFKQVNDRYGHLEGNRLLKLVAESFRECCREYDYVARMGGDEFVLVLPGVTPETMKTTVQRLADLTVLAGREVCGQPIVTLSVGFAHYPADGDNAEELLAEADRRMYAVKQYTKLERNRGYVFERQRIVGD